MSGPWRSGAKRSTTCRRRRPRRFRSERDAESALSDRRLVCDIDVAHPGCRRTSTTPLHEPVDDLSCPLRGDFHCAIPSVVNPPINAELISGPLAVSAERHTLYPACHDDPPADNCASWSWHLHQCGPVNVATTVTQHATTPGTTAVTRSCYLTSRRASVLPLDRYTRVDRHVQRPVVDRTPIGPADRVGRLSRR